MCIEQTISPLGENYFFVAMKFGRDIADAVTATPTVAISPTVSYNLFGNIKGTQLNSFGETIELVGLQDEISKDDFYLINGNFITESLFYVIDYMNL